MTSIVFPGQGAQSVGMCSGFAEDKVVRDIFDRASAAIDVDLWTMAQQGPAEEQNLTENTQPLLLTAGFAIFHATGIKAGNMAGHSLGEFTALAAANAISFEDAVKLVKMRGQFMQAAVPEGQGAMAAFIGTTDESAMALCEQIGDVWPANFNSVGQIVISGKKTAVDKAAELAKDHGIKKVIPLPVSIPSHCPLMSTAADKFSQELKKIDWQLPQVPVIHNATCAVATSVDELIDALTKQLTHPVPWTQIIAKLDNNVIEMGPGTVLAGLIKRTDKTKITHSINSPADLENV